MEIFSLDKSSIRYFGPLLLGDTNTAPADAITLGAIEDGKPAGILRFYIDAYGNAVILHFCVSPEFRRDYIGMRLFLRLFEILKASGSRKINCIVSREEKNQGALGFLKKAGFVGSEYRKAYIAPLYFWMDSKAIQTAEINSCIKPLQSLSKKERAALFEELFKEYDPGKIGMEEDGDPDSDHSFYFDEEFGKGCILIYKGILGYPEVIRLGVNGGTKASQMILGLIRSAIEGAMRNCEPDTNIAVRCSRENDIKLIEKIWPGVDRYGYVDLIKNIDAEEDEDGEG